MDIYWRCGVEFGVGMISGPVGAGAAELGRCPGHPQECANGKNDME
jgi:hypothetical protein